MSQLAIIRTAIAAAVATVPGVGQVHAYERYTRDEKAFRELYTNALPGGGSLLLGWWLRRNATRESSPNTGSGPDTLNVHTWHLRGYMALADGSASELAFDELVEAVRDVVRSDPTFGSVAEQGPYNDGDNADGAQVLDAGPVMFCGVLCHSVLLEIKTWSYL